MSSEYQMNNKDSELSTYINSDTEETTAISKISYEIENANLKNLSYNKVEEQMSKLKDGGDFPDNLEYIDSYTDKSTGTTSVAFKDENTNKVTIGMTGTNKANDVYKDIDADAHLVFDSITPKDVHYKNTQKFINKMEDSTKGDWVDSAKIELKNIEGKLDDIL